MQRVRHADSGVKGVALLNGLVAVASACLCITMAAITVSATTVLNIVSAVYGSCRRYIASCQKKTN